MELNRLIVCRWTARKGAPPRLVALLPQAEQFDEIGTQIKAPGFNMIILPFADDIRHLKFDESEQHVVASHEQIDKAKALISKLPVVGGFDYANPVLQRHYANSQALALDQEPEGDFEDHTLPAYDRIKLRAEEQIAEFKESIGLADVASNSADGTKKRPASDDPIAAITACKGDAKELAKFTVADLKAYLEFIGIKPKRVKAEIIEQILQ